ncbi:MAG TPA: hypothetical protein VF244_10445 [Acidimicrobiales bacterium]
MSKYHGKDSYFSIEEAGSSTLRAIGDYCDSIDFERNTDLADSTTIGLEDKTFLSGLTGGSVNLSGRWDDTATSGPDVVLSSLVGNEGSQTWEFGPAGNGTGKTKYTGEAFLEKYQVSAPLEGVVKFTAAFRITGAVTKSTFA